MERGRGDVGHCRSDPFTIQYTSVDHISVSVSFRRLQRPQEIAAKVASRTSVQIRDLTKTFSSGKQVGEMEETCLQSVSARFVTAVD